MTEDKQQTFEFESLPTIKGFPELHWTGKRPYRSTQYFPAQKKESYGETVIEYSDFIEPSSPLA